MTDTAAPARATGFLSIATGIAAFALLANHPGGDARTFADILKNEAANQAMNAIVHGGFIVVVALETVCYAVLSARLGFSRITAIAGLVFFAFGAAFLSGSLLLDGLTSPAVAARYLAAPNKIDFARSLFILIGATISFLMPIGLAFQSAAIACWGWALTASGKSRVAGVFGIALGGVLLAALAANFVASNPFVLMGAIAATAVWAIIVGIVLLRL